MAEKKNKMSKNMQDPNLEFWINYFINKKRNSRVPLSLDNRLNDIIHKLQNTQKLYSSDEINQKNDRKDQKSYLASLFLLDNKISDDEYLFISILNDLDLFKKNAEKITPFLMRAMIHYFYLLEQTFIQIESNLNSDIDLSIIDDKYTKSFFRIYLYLKTFPNSTDIFDQIFQSKYPICLINDSNNCFSSDSDINSKLRQFDSTVFRQIIELILYTHNQVCLFQLAEKYIFLLMDNFDNLKKFEFINYKSFFNSMMDKYIDSDFFKALYKNGKNEIIDHFIDFLERLEIDKKEKNFFQQDSSESLSLFDCKYQFINTMFNTIIQIIHSYQSCKGYLISKNFYQYLLRYSIWSFTNSNFLQILIKKDFCPSNSNNDKSQNVNLISSLNEISQISNNFAFSAKFSLDYFQKIDYLKNQNLKIPDEARNIISIIKKLVELENNSEFITNLFSEINSFIKSIKNNDFHNNFSIIIPDDYYIDTNALLMTSILIYCEIINYKDYNQLSQILQKVDFQFLFDDFIFERTLNDDSIQLNKISMEINSGFLQFVRNTLFTALLELSKIFLPQVVKSLSNFIIGSKISICDEIITFLIQLISENRPLISNFDTNLYIEPLISYGSLLHGNSHEMKQFYFLLSKLLSDSKIFKEFFENKLFVNFIFVKIYDPELTSFLIQLISNNYASSEKVNICMTKYLLIDSLKLLIDSNEKSDTKIQKIEQTFIEIIELFYFIFYFHRESAKNAIEETELLLYLDKYLTVFQSTDQFFSIMRLIYSLQYSNTAQTMKEYVNHDQKLILIYQKDYPNFSKVEITDKIKKMLGCLVFGYKFENIFEKTKASNDIKRKIIPIKCIESLWMVHNILKYNENHYFEYIDFVIDNLFCNQLILSDSQFLHNSLNLICKYKSNIRENEQENILKIFKKIVSHALIFDFPSELFLPSLSFNKINFLNIIEGCISKDSYNYPSNFAYLTIFNDNDENKCEGITFGPYSKFSFSFTVSFSFRFESIIFNESDENEEYIIFNEINNKFSIRITNEQTLQFYQKDSIILNDDAFNKFSVKEKEWHLIVISATYSKVFVAIDGKNAFPLKENSSSILHQQINYSFLSTKLSFCIGKKFEGLICDVQILNPENYTDSDILKFSTFNISNEKKMIKSIASFRPYKNSENKNIFFDPKNQKYQYVYEGNIVLEKNNLFRQLNDNDLISCIFINLNDSKILKKALKILLKLISIQNNSDSSIEKLIFHEDDSFLRFVFLLIYHIDIFNDEIFELCYNLFNKINNIKFKQIFVSEFLFNLNIWKTNFIKIYNRLIMKVLPSIIYSAQSDSNTIESVSALPILNAIENEESRMKKSFLFEILFSLLKKHLKLILSNKNHKKDMTKQIDSKILINKVENFLNDSYCIKQNAINLEIFNENEDDNSNVEMNHILIEIIKYIQNGNETIIASIILRLFGLIPMQINTISVLEAMNSNCKNIIFKRFFEICYLSSNNQLQEIDVNSFYKLTSYVTQNINNPNNCIDILFAVLISLSQKIKQIDFNTTIDIYESISDIPITNQNESCKIFFLLWTILLLSASFDQDDFVNKIIHSFLKNQSKESISSFIWMFYLFCINSDQFGFKKWKIFVDKFINSILLSLNSSFDNQKQMNRLIHIFIDFIISISLIADEKDITDSNNNEPNLLYLMNLIRGDKSFKIFNSFSLEKIKNGLNSYLKEVNEFCSILEKANSFTCDYDLIFFITILICSNSNTSDFIHKFIAILHKMDLFSSFSFDIISKLFRQLSVPQELIKEIEKEFPDFSFHNKVESDQNQPENSKPNQNSNSNENNTNSNENNTNSNENNMNSDENNTNSNENNTNSSIEVDSTTNDSDLIKSLILRFLINLLNNALVVSNYYVVLDFGKSSSDYDTLLRNLCNIEKNKFYLRSFQNYIQQTSNSQNKNENEDQKQQNKFIIFNTNYVPLLLTNKNPFDSIIEIENNNFNITKSCKNSSIAIEEVFFICQGTKKKCHLFYDLFKFDSFIIGGFEIQKENVNFIVNHSASSIEFFLNDGFQFIIEFISFSITDKSEEENPIIFNLIKSFVELSSSLINEKILQLSLNLIEITILLNFLNDKSFNLPDNQPIIKDISATQFILENDKLLNDESLKNWCIEFFKLGNTIDFNPISSNQLTKISAIYRCICMLPSRASFLSICNKKIFYVDAENNLRGASIILPPRVHRATIQIFNSNVLSVPIHDEFGFNEKHNRINPTTNSANAQIIAFNIIKNNLIASSNEFFVAASFNEFQGIFVYMVKMSELLFLKSFKLNDTVKCIAQAKNGFVFITSNSNKVHLIKMFSSSNELSSIEHRYFISHSTNVSIISTFQNFIVSIDCEKKVCLTLIESLQTVATFSIENIPKIVHITNYPSFRIIALFEEENKIASIDFDGKIIWEYKRNEKISDMLLLKDKTNMNSNVFIALLIDNNLIECRRMNEVQLIKDKKVEGNQKILIDDDFALLLSSSSSQNISHMKYDNESDFIGIGIENNLNAIFFEYSK